MGQRGNIFFALFGAVALVGLLGSVTMNILRGPVAGMARITDHTIARNDMIAASIMLSERTLAQDDADCDSDGMIEPVAYAASAGAPLNGGALPNSLGVATQDPWKRAYGYCAWDHGFWTRRDDVPGCGGDEAGRLNGANSDAQPAIALISAGPNGAFETSCHDYTDDDHKLVVKAAGSDDVVRLIPYGQFMMPSAAQARLDELPDAACMSGSIGLMRLVLGVVQVCTEGGWAELSPASGGEIDFEPVTNAMVGTQHTSNTITFGVLSADLPVSINHGGSLSVNGGAATASGTINSGDTLTLFGAAPDAPEDTNSYTIEIGSVTKYWTITTRDAYIGKLTITPSNTGSMNVTGPGNPAYGATLGFIVSNGGERPVGPLNPASLSNTTHFAFDATGGHVGDDCAGKTLNGTLAGAQSCVIDVRAKAVADAAYYEGTLSIGDGEVSASASMSGSASGWGCTVPWGDYIANGASVTAYAVPCSLLSCTSQSRTCTNGVLSGSYQHQTCNVLLSCL